MAEPEFDKSSEKFGCVRIEHGLTQAAIAKLLSEGSERGFARAVKSRTSGPKVG